MDGKHRSKTDFNILYLFLCDLFHKGISSFFQSLLILETLKRQVKFLQIFRKTPAVLRYSQGLPGHFLPQVSLYHGLRKRTVQMTVKIKLWKPFYIHIITPFL